MVTITSSPDVSDFFCQVEGLNDIRFFSINSIYPYSSIGAGRAALSSILYVGKGGIRKPNEPPKLIIEAWHRGGQ